jgi:putative nucleotidyltransferase with HDIG domain
MRTVHVSHLAIGQTIAKDVINARGLVILGAGTRFSPQLATLFRAWGIEEVCIDEPIPIGPDTASTSAPPTTPSPRPESEAEGKATLHPALAALTGLAARRQASGPGLADAGGGGAAPTKDSTQEESPISKTPWSPISAHTVASRAGTLASLPSVYSHVERAINNPSNSVADIAKILQNDQALCARLLRIANSAFYGAPRRVERLDDAVRIIGTRQLHDLVLATVVLTQFKGMDAHLVSMPSFWRHSLACAVAARTIAQLCHEPNAERFFVAGLLHDIGSLVLYQQLADRAQIALERHRRGEQALDEAERAIIGCDHGSVGAALMASWRLPEFYREAAASHHGLGHRSHTVGTAVVHLGDLVALALDLGHNGEVRLPRFSVEAWDLVGLAPESLRAVADQVLGFIGEAESVFLGDEAAA